MQLTGKNLKALMETVELIDTTYGKDYYTNVTELAEIIWKEFNVIVFDEEIQFLFEEQILAVGVD